MRAYRPQRQNGQAMVVLCAIISILILFVVGLFSYEVNRVEVCRTQLRSATEAAALAAAATLASQDNQDPAAAHNEAIQTAISTFTQNSVAGTGLANAILAFGNNDSPTANHSSLFIEFLDPNRNNVPVNVGDPAGKIVRITSAFGLLPSFGNFLGLSTVPLRTTAMGGVPDLDVVLCFDCSGSIDDQTPVSMVRREWVASSGGKVQYTVASTRAGSAAGALAQGRIYDIIGPAPTGTRVNALYPQNLAQVGSGNRWNLQFSPALRSRAPSSSGTTNNESNPVQGYPPGNLSSTVSGVDRYTVTDVVVNIDGKNTFGGLTTGDGYAFPDIATLVEASRGNLENDTVFRNSRANTGVPSTIRPRAGYQAKYFEMARNNCHPIKDAQDAAATFFTVMNTNTVGHFSLSCFSDDGGGSTVRDWRIDSSYTAAGYENFEKPMIPLSRAVGDTKYNTIIGALPGTEALHGTNIGDTLNVAVTQLSTNSRPGSKKAIVLFTDGMPTVGGPLSGDPWTNARLAADRARRAGIPIYSIGLAQNPEIVPQETQILTDANSSLNSGGVSGIAGHGGKFFLVTDTKDLRLTFENIARQLVQLVH